MGKYSFTALRVRDTTLKHFANGKIGKLPRWVGALDEVPPAEVLVRNRPPQHQLVRQRMKTAEGSSKPQVVFEVQDKRRKPKKASRLFLPVELKFEEDQLRKEFYRDHPWELARPRVLLENSGKDFENHDWSRIQQPGKKLDGESVVQRQLWLLNNVPDMTKTNAYDIARREFYRLRLREDIERRVAAEEAEATGATFGPSYLEIGMELENKEYEKWKAWARSKTQVSESIGGGGGGGGSAGASTDVDAEDELDLAAEEELEERV